MFGSRRPSRLCRTWRASGGSTAWPSGLASLGWTDVEVIDDEAATKASVESLMGTKPEARFRFIQERAEFVEELDI